ncbi:DUF2959 family protein [Thermodesulfobacteriota bacterium]
MYIRIKVFSLFFIILSLVLFGCQSTYYSVWEKLGIEKRHLLRDKVSQVQTEQEKASAEFKDVLTQIKELYGFQGGELEKFYNKLQNDYEACVARAEGIEKRIEQVERIARDLFAEWGSEVDQIANVNLRSKSKKSLEDTKVRYARLKKSMDKAGASMEPVLIHLKDYVLYLKHNLNAQAIGTLKQEVIRIETAVRELIRYMESSIGEADLFLRNLQ